MLKNDSWIKTRAAAGMITPFQPNLIREVEIYADTPGVPLTATQPVFSYGCSSYGYDIRLSPKTFYYFRHIPGTVVDPKDFQSDNLAEAKLQRDSKGSFFILPAHTYGLGVALECLTIPDNITVIALGKSSYARAGIIANMTPAEAGWRGHLTLEFSNSSHADCRIYANEGIIQLLFFEGEPCDTTYAARRGKYQDQPHTVVPAKV